VIVKQLIQGTFYPLKIYDFVTQQINANFYADGRKCVQPVKIATPTIHKS